MMAYTFNRQKPLNRYIVDFYCKPLKLVIAIDGSYHEEKMQKIKDSERQQVGAQGLVHYEENGEKALKYLERCFVEGNLPSLVILDLNMPRMNGTQTLRAIKSDQRFRNLRVMIYSTSLNPIEKEECMLLGAEDYVIRPVAYDESLQIARYFKQFCEKMTAL